eukprot:s1975_g4.t1
MATLEEKVWERVLVYLPWANWFFLPMEDFLSWWKLWCYQWPVYRWLLLLWMTGLAAAHYGASVLPSVAVLLLLLLWGALSRDLSEILRKTVAAEAHLLQFDSYLLDIHELLEKQLREQRLNGGADTVSTPSAECHECPVSPVTLD